MRHNFTVSPRVTPTNTLWTWFANLQLTNKSFFGIFFHSFTAKNIKNLFSAVNRSHVTGRNPAAEGGGFCLLNSNFELKVVFNFKFEKGVNKAGNR